MREVICINKNTTLKIRSVCHGYIESDIYELDIKVQKGETNNEFTNNFERPENLNDNSSLLDSVNFSGIEEEIMQNENFVSWHENNSYNTPKE